MKKGQEKAFQVVRTVCAKALWQEGGLKRNSKKQGRGEGTEAGNGQELEHTGLREESTVDLGIKEKPESPQLQESGGEGNDQFIFKRTFSGPRA